MFVVSSPGRVTYSGDADAVKKYRARKKKQAEEAKLLLERSIREREMQRKIYESRLAGEVSLMLKK